MHAVLAIENIYPDGTQNAVAAVDVPAMPSEAEAREEWAYEHLFPMTGTGRTEGNSAYVVTITESDISAAVGQMFEFGI
jgi:hypothetical protein